MYLARIFLASSPLYRAARPLWSAAVTILTSPRSSPAIFEMSSFSVTGSFAVTEICINHFPPEERSFASPNFHFGSSILKPGMSESLRISSDPFTTNLTFVRPVSVAIERRSLPFLSFTKLQSRPLTRSACGRLYTTGCCSQFRSFLYLAVFPSASV